MFLISVMLIQGGGSTLWVGVWGFMFCCMSRCVAASRHERSTRELFQASYNLGPRVREYILLHLRDTKAPRSLL